MRTLILAVLPLALAACTGVSGPGSRLGANYQFRSTGAEADLPGRNPDTEVSAYDVTYEFLPFGSNNNLAVSWLHRTDDYDNSTTEINSDIARVQLRWNYTLIGPLTWYLGPGIGYAFSVDGNNGNDYGGSLYYDGEVGVRWKVYDPIGVQAMVNYSRLNASGDSGAPDADLSALTVGVGAFIDF